MRVSFLKVIGSSNALGRPLDRNETQMLQDSARSQVMEFQTAGDVAHMQQAATSRREPRELQPNT